MSERRSRRRRPTPIHGTEKTRETPVPGSVEHSEVVVDADRRVELETVGHDPEVVLEPEPVLESGRPSDVVAKDGETEVLGVKFRGNGKVYSFDPEGTRFDEGVSVIVETVRGIEIGTVEEANHTVDSVRVVEPLRKVIRAATAEDLKQAEHNEKAEARALKICAKKVEEHGLEMHLTGAEYTFDRGKLLFYFTSEGRVDFRDLVRDLAAIFKTRIELRQIGVRDEARMIGGLGSCGRPLCCATFLQDFVPVSIKMAKSQELSLNPGKISGMCGRLMCCLRFEHDAYTEGRKGMPKVGRSVMTPDGPGEVVELNVMGGRIAVRLEDGEFKRYDVSEVTEPK